MLVTLIGRNSISKLNLPQKIDGNYWLCDQTFQSKEKLINIEAIDGHWQVKSNNYCKIVNPKNIKICNGKLSIVKNEKEILKNVILKNYSYYFVRLGNQKELYVLNCSPIYEDNYTHLHIKNPTSIFIGNDKNENQVVYSNPLISKIHAKIFLNNNVLMIENYDKRFNTYVNGKPISDSVQILYNGNQVTILGLKIIVLNNELFINNPLNKVSWDKNYFEIIKHKNNNDLVIKDEEDFKNYLNNNYFLRAPRMLDFIEKTELQINQPPPNNKNKELPIALVLGSMLSMAAMSIVSMIQTLDNFLNGKATKKSTLFSLIMSGTMILSSLLLPVANQRYAKKMAEKDEKEKNENYKKYINDKLKLIDEISEKNRSILYNTYVSTQECIDIILNKSPRLWERKISDKDFLTVRLGIGNITSDIEVKLSANSKEFEEDNELYQLMCLCADKIKKLPNAPVILSLTEKNISAILYKNEVLKYKFMENILLQLVTFHSYDELKIVFLLKDNSNKKWDFAKMLPHTWNNLKTIRYFAENANEIKEVAQSVEEELKKRLEDDFSKFNYRAESPYYLIITDDFKTIENLNLTNLILKNNEINIGATLLMLSTSMTNLPNECQTFVNIEGNNGTIFESQNSASTSLTFKTNMTERFYFNEISQALSNIPIKLKAEKSNLLPTSYTFLEMFNVGCIEQLNIWERWKNNDSTLSLSAPIGIDGYGEHICLDIHEKFHGPHGLVAGSTGSGKSEFIITYILSLAVNYHPDDVTFVLIDYKGGGLAGAFKRPDVQLPHLVGTITNIDKGSLQRSLESIESELKRRQVEFNEARNITGESTMDIYKYQKYYHDGVLKKPISHLFIISDEFAELKQQEPEFMDELISVARIGRSLGVHLILATQKPSGVVNDQIRSNVKFGICLKVQSPADSKDVIDLPDAANLRGAGQFYIKVGNADYLALGQSAWAGALYYPSNEVKKEFDNSIEFISDTGMILKKVDDTNKNTSESKGEQITNVVKYICDLAEKENIHETPLWLNPIPETIYLKDIREKYNVKKEKNVINPVLGEYDDPSRQLQDVMTLNLTKDGNTIIYGNAESGKETMLSTMIYDIITNYSSEEVNIYILDFGSEVMKIFKKAPHVGDVIFVSEAEKIARFFMMLQKELKDRKEILSEYNGDYKLYLKSTDNIMPTYVIVLNNYETFTENYPNKYDDILEILLREGAKYGFAFVFTVSTTSGLRYRMLQNFRQKIALQMNKDDDYLSIFDHVGKKRPSRLFGRGLINPEPKKFYECQIAKICEPEAWNEHLKEIIAKLNENVTYKANEIPVVPEIVTINHLETSLINISNFPIGISQKNITPSKMDLTKNLITNMITIDLEENTDFVINIIEEIKMLKDIEFVILDAENIVQNRKEDLMDKYVTFFKKLNSEKELKDSLCVIIGLDKFINEIGSEEMFFESLKNAEELQKLHYIILETSNKLNNYNHSEWFEKYSSNDTGLWLGNGVEEQYILKSSVSSMRLLNECGPTYGYVFNKGKPSLVKLLGMKEKSEENE